MSETSPARPVRIARSFMTVGGWTGISRIFGFVRDILIAGLLGAGPIADAFFVAFRLPNMFRRFFAEGAFNMAFVPLFAKRLEGEGVASARRFAEETLSVLLTVLLAVTLLAQLGMPLLIFALAAGFADDPERFDLAVTYGRIQFPYLLCMSLTALFSAVLNALGRFAAPAAAPVLLNVTLIAAMLLSSSYALAPGGALPVGEALAWGVLVAGVLQVALVAGATMRAGLSLKLRRPRLTPGVRRLVRLGIPGAIAGGVLQVNTLIGTVIASFFEGAVSWLSYADRLYQLPLGIVGIAIGVVLLPELSRRVRADDTRGARDALNRAAEFALLLTLPAAMALAVIPDAIVGTLFERGRFTEADTTAVAWALGLFALGLPAFVLQKVMQPVFFAREDMRSPLRYAAWSVAVNIAISVGGAFVIGYLAIPLATSIAGWLQVILLWRGARGFGVAAEFDARLRQRIPRMLRATLVMGALLAVLGHYVLDPMLNHPEHAARWTALGIKVLAAIIVYGLVARFVGAFDTGDVRAALRRGR